MKIKNVTYLGSYAFDGTFPGNVGPEFAFVGRSNVGKSSLINTLIARRNLARTSNTPGKTRTANFYPINDTFCFVDLPGYGYAKVSKKERASWTRLIRSYLNDSKSLCGVVHLMDIRHTPSREDQDTAAMLRELERPVCIVFNKLDKLKKRDIDRHIAAHLGVLTLDPHTAVIPFSAETGYGKRLLWAWIEDRLSL